MNIDKWFTAGRKGVSVWVIKAVTVSALAVALVLLVSVSRSDELSYRHFARSVAANYKLDQSLFEAIGKVESDYKPGARGGSGEIGMFQVKPETVLTVTGGVDPYAGLKRTYQFGSTGPEVAKIQEALNERGADILVDGVWGVLTNAAFLDFQHVHGLAEDGIAGRQSLATLGLGLLSGRSIVDALKDPFTNTIWAAEVLVWCRNYLGRSEPGVLLTCYNSGPGSAAVRYMKKVFEEVDRINSGVTK